MADMDDVMHALGEIKGELKGITSMQSDHTKRMNHHSERIDKLEVRQNRFMGGVTGVVGFIGAWTKAKGLW